MCTIRQVLTYMDFDNQERLEQFQLEQHQNIEIISLTPIERQVWVEAFFNPKQEYSSGYKKTNDVRLIYKKNV